MYFRHVGPNRNNITLFQQVTNLWIYTNTDGIYVKLIIITDSKFDVLGCEMLCYLCLAWFKPSYRLLHSVCIWLVLSCHVVIHSLI